MPGQRGFGIRRGQEHFGEQEAHTAFCTGARKRAFDQFVGDRGAGIVRETDPYKFAPSDTCGYEITESFRLNTRARQNLHDLLDI